MLVEFGPFGAETTASVDSARAIEYDRRWHSYFPAHEWEQKMKIPITKTATFESVDCRGEKKLRDIDENGACLWIRNMGLRNGNETIFCRSRHRRCNPRKKSTYVHFLPLYRISCALIHFSCNIYLVGGHLVVWCEVWDVIYALLSFRLVDLTLGSTPEAIGTL